MLLLGFYPLLQVFLLSTRYESLTRTGFAGLANYVHVLSDGVFWQALQHSAVYVVASIVGHIGIGGILAVLLYYRQGALGTNALRTLIVLPWAVTPSVAASLWRLIYHAELSIVPKIADSLGIHLAWDWLSRPDLALAAIVVTNLWIYTPFYLLMMLARLQSLPPELLDAAQVDGASWWQTVIRVVVPQLRNVVLTLVTFDVAGTFIQFDLVWVMTGGGPLGSTEVLPTYIYRNAFNSFDFGVAAASGVVLFLLLLVTSRYLLRGRQGDAA